MSTKKVGKSPVGRVDHKPQTRNSPATLGVFKSAAPDPGLPVGEVEDCLNRTDTLLDEFSDVVSAVRQRFDPVLTYIPLSDEGKATAILGKNSPLSNRIHAQNERLADHIAAMRALVDRCAL